MVPIIGITTRVDEKERLYAQNADYAEAVCRAGGVPVLIPPVGEEAARAASRIDGLLLTGGPDVDPGLYGGAMHEAVYGVNPVRDAAEIALLRAALGSGIPVLGICRGIQLINVALGGTLIEHLSEEGEIPHRNGPSESARHRVDIRPGTLLSAILGKESAEPVSFHHQAIRKLAPRLDVAATAPDGVVEAVILPDHPFFVAVQWHPERTAAADPDQQAIFDAFIRAAAAFAGGREHSAAPAGTGHRAGV